MSLSRREKRKENRRFKKFMNKEWNIKLWSIPQPYAHTFEGRGYESLYHFTCGDKLNDILKYGIIFGDVHMRDDEGFNAPCLTTEGHRHNPMLFREESVPFSVREGLIRLTVETPKDQENLINLGWFDAVYCHKYIRDGFASQGKNHKKYGDIDKQYFYKGHIKPSMITGIKIWDEESKEWKRIRKSEKERICSKYENAKYPLTETPPNQLRILGYQLHDYTGMVNQYNYENHSKDIFSDFYELSDFICGASQQFGKNPEIVEFFSLYKKSLMEIFGKNNFNLEDMVTVLDAIVYYFNYLIKGLRMKDDGGEIPFDEIDIDEYGMRFLEKYKEYREWLVEYRKSSLDDYPLDEFLIKNEEEEEVLV